MQSGLEFLGDAVLGLIVSEWLMEQFPAEQEGELTRLRSALVQEKKLCEVSRALGLGSYLHLGKGEERMGAKGTARTGETAPVVARVMTRNPGAGSIWPSWLS